MTVEHHHSSPIIKPVSFHRGEPMWSKKDVNELAANDIIVGNQLAKRIKKVTTDYETAASEAENTRKLFDRNLSLLISKQVELQDSVKKVNGNVRRAADELAQGLARVEKQANFDKLERYVDLLERAAKAMSILADLESSGRLDKIAGALK